MTLKKELQKNLGIYHKSFDVGFTPMGILIINIETNDKSQDIKTLQRIQEYLKNETKEVLRLESIMDETCFGFEYIGSRLDLVLNK